MSTITTSLFDPTKTWTDFNQKFHTLTTDRELLPRTQVERIAPLSDQEQAAAKKIASWWKRVRASGRFITCTSTGSHPPEFHTLLVGKTIKRRLSYFQDNALLRELETAPWQSERFRDSRTQHSALNLFAAGKISWQQKATLSLICETAQVFGDFTPIKLLNEAADDLSPEAAAHITPFLKYSPFYFEKPTYLPKDGFLTDEEKKRFIALVRELPASEQYIFNFSRQHRNAINNGSPSEDSEMRSSHTRFLNRSQETYSGIVLFSHGVRNAVGLSHYSVSDWVPLIPRLGEQTIDDVEYFIKRGARVTVSGESRELGLTKSTMYLHGIHMNYPDNFAHDEYHSLIASELGQHVLRGLDKIIDLERMTFGVRWSKDLWILRDGDLATDTFSLESRDSIEINTSIFAACLQGRYHPMNHSEIGNFIMEGVPLLFGKDGFPNQVLLAFIIDLVRNPREWQKVCISDDEGLYDACLPTLIKMAKFLNSQQLFTESSKSNILQFDHFVRAHGPLKNNDEWIDWKAPEAIKSELLAQMQEIAKESDSYKVKVMNKGYFLGFVKHIEMQPTEFIRQLIDACKAADIKVIEHLLEKHKHLLTYDTFNTALSHVSDPAVAEVLLTKSGHYKFPLDASGKLIMPTQTPPEQDNTFYQTESGLLKKQINAMQTLLTEKDAYIAALQARIDFLNQKIQVNI